MSAADMLPQCRDPVLFLARGNGHAEPSVIQMRREIDLLRPLGQKQILVLGIALHFGKYLIPPLCSPAGKVTHSSEQKNLGPRFLHKP